MSDGRAATPSTLLFHHSRYGFHIGYGFLHLFRLLINITMLLCRIDVACTFFSTLGLFIAAYDPPMVERPVYYYAIAILVFSWCFTITVIFEVIDDFFASFPGLGHTGSADCFAEPRYWKTISSLLVNSIQDV
ncbi:unnamed protein product [Clonostachys chloroleuca]|uniref:Uncharacterized protein n=1 Tax=Clonostachys chloroleuca TaxID=1926264 RepID=A0AA35M0F5_9HYPO|nr:unnamed protein product [Clonostachys chloroleuca]